jgi:hypothetical protein
LKKPAALLRRVFARASSFPNRLLLARCATISLLRLHTINTAELVVKVISRIKTGFLLSIVGLPFDKAWPETYDGFVAILEFRK